MTRTLSVDFSAKQLVEAERWAVARRTWWDVLCCVLGYHRVVTDVCMDGMRVRRCSCGAFYDYIWFYATKAEHKGKWERR